MKEKLRKKIVWDEHGITEILADILILAMTVVLFAIIFAFVYTLPTPNEATYADFVTDIDLYEPSGVRINVTHTSGEDLYKGDTDIYLFQNPGTSGQVVKRLLTQDTGYGIPGPDSTWSPGETWTYYLPGVVASDELEIKIVDTRAQILIMSAKLLGAGVNDAPIIMERWYSPKPAINASTLTIYTNVLDRDGFNDIDSVYANVSALNSSVPSMDFTAISHTKQVGTFKGEVVIDKGEGSYTLTLTAEDSFGLIDRRRIVIDVAYTGLNAPRILERWSNPMLGVNGTDITVFATVKDLDGYDNIEFVTIDIGPLENPNGTSHIVYMKDPEKDGTFIYSTVIYVAKGDLYRVNFTAQDKTGLIDHAHLNITVNKFNPVIARTWTVPIIGKDEESMTIFAEVSDPDGYSDLKEVMVNLTALNPTLGWHTMFDLEQDGIFEYDLTINVTTGGNKTVFFLARDMNGNDVTAQMKVFVSTLNAPVIGPRWTDPSFPDNNSQLTIYAMVMDPDGYDDIDTVRVYIAGLNRTLNGSAAWVEMIDPNQDGNFFNISWVDQEAGTYILEFIATDKGGNMAFATLNFTILPYRPRFLNVWTNPTIGRNGSYIQLFANVMDPNGYADIANVTVDIVHLNQSFNQSTPVWMEMIDFNRNGTFLNVTKINVNKTGLYSLNFTVKDNSGNIATTNHQLIVTSYKPTIVQAWHVPKPALNGTNVTIYAWVRDDDGVEDISSVMLNVSALSKTLTWVNMTDPKGNGVYSKVTFIDAINATGTYYVTLVATDSTGNSYNTTLGVEISSVAVGEEQGATIVGIVIPNGVSGGGTVYINALAINGTSPDDKIVKVTFQLINGPLLVWPPGSPTGEVQMNRVYEMLFRDPVTGGRTAPYATQYNDVVYIIFRAYNSTTISPEYKIAEETLTLLVIWDKSGGKVTEGTALEQNVAWISGEQGYVITNNKSTPDPHQIFDITKAEDEMVWIKVGSNIVTNTEKANIFKLHSRTMDVDVEPYSSMKFKYDGVLAGYWFFVLNFSAKELYNGWMATNGLTSEYFDVYIKVKDSTDDFFATNSWIVVHGGTMDFYAEIMAYYYPYYVPGGSTWDPNNPLFPSGLMRADSGTPLDVHDDHIFNSTERLYLKLVVITPTDTYPNVDANQAELVDFVGNRPIANVPGAGPVSIIERDNPLGGAYDYWVVIDLLRADKDPWVIGKSAYTVFIRDFYDNDEQYDFMSTHILIHSPTSILDVVSGMPSQSATTRDNYVGFYYENIGIFDKNPYEIIPGGADDDVEAIWSVAFADLDNDEKKDVVAAAQAGYLYLYQNNGFWTRQVLDTITGEAFTNVHAGDIDDDGDEDIVAGDSAGNVYYYENDGSWGGTPDQTITGGFGSIGDTTKNEDHADIGDHALGLIDIDNDYALDLVIGSANGLYYSLYNPATKQFETATQIFTRSVYCVAVGDINQDGDNDIAFSDNDNKHIWVEFNDGTPTTTYFDNPAVQIVNNYGTEASIAVGNLDGQDWLEVVVGRDTLRVYTYSIAGGTWGLASNQPSGYVSADHGEITSIVVDNVDGAIEEDIMVATAGDLPSGDGGFIFYFRNMGLGSEYLLMQPPVENLKQNIGVTQEICTITLGDADEGLA